MKMILISYYVGIEDELMEILSSLGIAEFTKWERVLGQGKTSGPHLGTHIWPKTNALLALAINDQKVSALLDKIKSLKSSPLGQEGIKAFIWPLEEMV
ncbi:MAG: PG0541 family transporter-associated protein [Thermodesulfobacteriota bacterium]